MQNIEFFDLKFEKTIGLLAKLLYFIKFNEYVFK